MFIAKDNVRLNIDKNEFKDYEKKGYKEVNKKGKIITKNLNCTNCNILTKKIKSQNDKISELENDLVLNKSATSVLAENLNNLKKKLSAFEANKIINDVNKNKKTNVESEAIKSDNVSINDLINAEDK